MRLKQTCARWSTLRFSNSSLRRRCNVSKRCRNSKILSLSGSETFTPWMPWASLSSCMAFSRALTRFSCSFMIQLISKQATEKTGWTCRCFSLEFCFLLYKTPLSGSFIVQFFMQVVQFTLIRGPLFLLRVDGLIESFYFTL